MPEPSDRADGLPPRVVLVAVPESSPAALYGLHELLGAVGRTWEAMTGEPAASPGFDVAIVAGDGRPLRCHGGVTVHPQGGLDAAGRPDIAIVPELYLTPADEPRGRWAAEAAALRRWHEEGTVACSVCTGSVLLAEAGLLDGREATCHWGAREIFARCYPRVRLHAERVLCEADAARSIVTGGGATSWEDVALYLVARFCGHAEAVRTAKLFVLGDRSEGQLLYAAMARPRRHEDAAIAASQGWIAEHYAAPSPVAAMVAVSGLGERTFKRRFRAATGYAPIDYVQALRVEEARQMLETTDLPTEEIAHAVGYDDPAFFRRLFRRRTGVTPARYRQRFASLRGSGAR